MKKKKKKNEAKQNKAKQIKTKQKTPSLLQLEIPKLIFSTAQGIHHRVGLLVQKEHGRCDT